MSVLCARPDSEFFQTIPDIHDAAENFEVNDVLSKLEQLGRIFVKHSVEKEFGLVMVHRHFDVSKDEILIETLNDEKSVSVTSPWIIKDTTVVVPQNETLWMEHDTKMKQYVVPQTWSYDKSGSLKPTEFLASDKQIQAPPQLFAAELHSELKKLGLEGSLGIRSIVNYFGRSSYEVTPDNSRSSVVVFGTKPNNNAADESSIPVLWYFDENGKMYLGAQCQFCHICFTCK